MLQIDGSYLEGGGAILRMAAALSAITAKPVRIFNIRANRKKPGLMTQHLESLKAIAALCSGELRNAFIGSTEIELYPGKVSTREISVEIFTAGAIGLLFQSICAPLCMADGDVTISVNGGATFGKWAPPLLTSKLVLLPTLKKMGYTAEIEILRHGFYPKGGAQVKITSRPCGPIQPLVLAGPGEARVVQGVSIASNHLQRAQVADRQAQSAREVLSRNSLVADIKTEYVDAACPGSGIVLWTQTSTGAIIGGDSIGERGKPSEKIGEEAASQILQTLHAGAAVDEHLSDQLLIFMALAEGKSAFTTPRLTDHAKTNIHVIKQFLSADFYIHEDRVARIECAPPSQHHSTEFKRKS